MSIPFLSVKPRAIKLKVSPRFPAQVIGRAGIDVTKQNGDYFFDLDYNDFPTIGAVPAQATNALIYNPATGQYAQLPIALLGGGGSSGNTVYISDTPPVGAADNSLWWESDTGALYVRYHDIDGAQWVGVVGGASASQKAGRTITGADTLVSSDFGKLIKFNSASPFTLAVSAAASLGDGWFCDIININTGVCTFDPNGAELVDGVTTAGIAQSERMRIRCDGTSFYTTDHAGDWLSYTPTFSASGGGTFTAITGTIRYRKVRTLVTLNYQITLTTPGSALNYIQFTLPVNVGSLSPGGSMVGDETLATGKLTYAHFNAGSTAVAMRFFDNTGTATVAGAGYTGSGIYECNK